MLLVEMNSLLRQETPPLAAVKGLKREKEDVTAILLLTSVYKILRRQ